MNRTRIIIQTMITLASAALGLVAALAWNEAIKETITSLLGKDEGLLGLYAILATVIAIVVLLILAGAAARIGGGAVIEREAEG